MNIRNFASSLLIVGAMALTPMISKAESVYMPLVSNPIMHCSDHPVGVPKQCPHTSYIFFACIKPELGCDPKQMIFVDNETWHLVQPGIASVYEDGGVSIQIENYMFGACVYPDMGCSIDSGVDIRIFNNGFVEFAFGI